MSKGWKSRSIACRGLRRGRYRSVWAVWLHVRSVACGDVYSAAVSDFAIHAPPWTQGYSGSGHIPPLSSHAAHFIIYHWVYAEEEEYDRVVSAIQQVRDFINNDKERFEEWAATVISSCGTEFSNHFARRAAKLLSNDRVLGHDAVCLIALCHTFMLAEPAKYCEEPVPNKPCLILHLMFACRRQICSTTDPHYTEIFVMSTLQIFQYVAIFLS